MSNGSGRVEIFWRIEGGGKDKVLKFTWKERGGPPAKAPARRGLDTLLLRATFTDVRIDYLVEGLAFELDLLLDRARSGAPASSQ